MSISVNGNEPQLEVVEIDELNVDRTYQRALNQRWVEKILSKWDPIAADALTVSRRPAPSARERRERNLKGDGTLWVVNGQHEAMAAALAGEAQMLAFVHVGLTRAQEAALRLKKNARRSDTPGERFAGQIAEGDPETLAIVALLTKFETVPNRTHNAHTGINAVSTLETLYRDDPAVFEQMLRVLKEAYERLAGGVVTTPPLRAVHWFLKVHDGEFHWRSFVERMDRLGYEELMRHTRSYQSINGGALWLNYYRALVEMYNYKRPEHTRLEVKTKYSASIDISRWRGGDPR